MGRITCGRCYRRLWSWINISNGLEIRHDSGDFWSLEIKKAVDRDSAYSFDGYLFYRFGSGTITKKLVWTLYIVGSTTRSWRVSEIFCTRWSNFIKRFYDSKTLIGDMYNYRYVRMVSFLDLILKVKKV